MDDLIGKCAIVTGGASGIGRATALLFAREGAFITIADIDRTAGHPYLPARRRCSRGSHAGERVGRGEGGRFASRCGESARGDAALNESAGRGGS